MPDRALHGVVNAVLAGTFDEAACVAVEQFASSSAGPFILEKLVHKFSRPDATLSDLQATVLFTYLHRFLLVFGPDKLVSCHGLLLRHMRTRSLELERKLKDLSVDLMLREPSFGDSLLVLHIAQRSPLSLRILTKFAEFRPQWLFTKLYEHLQDDDVSSRFCVLEVLTVIAQRQGPHFAKIIETSMWSFLLELLQMESDEVVLNTGLWLFSMFIPHLRTYAAGAAALKDRFHDLLLIFKRALCWNGSTNQTSTSHAHTHTHTSQQPASTHTAQHISNSHTGSTQDRSATSGSTVSSRAPSPLLKQSSQSANVGEESAAPSWELRRAAVSFFLRLYDIFPTNVIQFLKSECESDSLFKRRLRPLLRRLPFHPALVEGSGSDGTTFAFSWQRIEDSLSTDDRAVKEGGEHHQQEERKAIDKDPMETELFFHFLEDSAATFAETFRDFKPHLATVDAMDASSAFPSPLPGASPVHALTSQQETFTPSFGPVDSRAELVQAGTDTQQVKPSLPLNASFSEGDTLFVAESTESVAVTEEGASNVALQQTKSALRSPPNLQVAVSRMADSDEVRTPVHTPNQHRRAVSLGHSKTSPGPVSPASLSPACRSTDSNASLTVRKLLALHETIERNLYVGALSDPWQLTITPDPIPPLAQNSAVLQKQVLLLRNELLFERYLRQQYLDHMKALRRQTQGKRQAVSPAHASTDAKTGSQMAAWSQPDPLHAPPETSSSSRSKTLAELMDRERHEIKEWKEKRHAWEQELASKLAKVTEQRNRLSEDNILLRDNATINEKKLQDLQGEVDEKRTELFLAHARIGELQAKVDRLASCDTQNERLSKELHAWQSLSRKQLEHAAGQIAQDKASISEVLMRQLSKERSEKEELQRLVKQQEQQLLHLESSLEAAEDRVKAQGDWVELQRRHNVDKLRVVEDKYKTVKQINVRLEQHIIELQCELEISKNKRHVFSNEPDDGKDTEDSSSTRIKADSVLDKGEDAETQGVQVFSRIGSIMSTVLSFHRTPKTSNELQLETGTVTSDEQVPESLIEHSRTEVTLEASPLHAATDETDAAFPKEPSRSPTPN